MADSVRLRTGVDVKAGKNIRIDAEGFENFSDYFTSPEQDQASDGSVTSSPVSTRDGRRKQVLRTSNAGTTQSSLSFTPVTEPTVSSSTFATTGDTGNEISSSRTDHCPSTSSVQTISNPGVARESSDQADAQEGLKANISSGVEIQVTDTDQQLLVAPSPERFGTRKRLTYSGTPVSSGTTLEVATRISAAMAVSSDAELQEYAGRLKAALQVQTNNIINDRQVSSASNDTTHVESSDSVSFKQPETGVGLSSYSSSNTKDTHQDGDAAVVDDTEQASSCTSHTRNERHSVSKSGADKLKCDSTSSSRMVNKSAKDAMPDNAGSSRAAESHLTRSMTSISGVVGDGSGSVQTVEVLHWSGAASVEKLVHNRQSKGNSNVSHTVRDSPDSLQTAEGHQASGVASVNKLGLNRQSRSVAIVEVGPRDSSGSSYATSNRQSGSATGVDVVAWGVAGSSNLADVRPSSIATSLEDVARGTTYFSHTSIDRQSMSVTSVVGAMQVIAAPSLQLASDCQFDCNADDDEFEILDFHENRKKPHRANAFHVRKFSEAAALSSGIQKRKRDKASKSEMSKTIVSQTDVMSSCSTQKQLATNETQTKSGEVATAIKSDHVDLNDSSVGARKNKTIRSGPRSVMSAKQRSRKLSVYDLEPDDDEEFSGAQSLALTKERLKEKKSSRKEHSKRSSKTGVGVVVRQSPCENKSANSVKGKNSKKRLSAKIMSKSPVINIKAGKNKKKHISVVCLSAQNDAGNGNVDSACGTNNNKSPVKQVTPSITGVLRRSSKLHIDESNCISMVNPTSASVSGPLVPRQSESIATLSSAAGLFPASFMTSTPISSRQIPPQRGLLTGSSRSVAHPATMLTDVEEASGRRNTNTADNLRLSVLTNETCNIVNSLKRKKKRLPMLSVIKRRKTASGTAKKKSIKSVANSIASNTELQMSTSFSPEVDRRATVDATGDSYLPRYSTASPLHYFEVTGGESQATSGADTLHKKIIVPSESQDGLRRSSRTRVQTLDWFRGERIRYKPNKSGFVVAGIDSPKPDSQKEFGKRLRQEIRKQMRQEKKMEKRGLPQTPHNLSVHVAMPPPEEEELTTNPSIPVLNCDINAEVLMECIKVREQFNILNATGDPAVDNDSLTICKPLRHPSFCSGFLTIRPLQNKEMQYVQNDTLVFCVMRGKVELTIHRTQQVIESSDMFCVPKGNRYSIRNLRNDEAKLFFVQLKN